MRQRLQNQRQLQAQQLVELQQPPVLQVLQPALQVLLHLWFLKTLPLVLLLLLLGLQLPLLGLLRLQATSLLNLTQYTLEKSLQILLLTIKEELCKKERYTSILYLMK
jgi:hypothetical protein